jgi:hypothetical protein
MDWGATKLKKDFCCVGHQRFEIWCVKIWPVKARREQVISETSASHATAGVYGHAPPVALSHWDSPRHRRRLGSFLSIIAFFLYPLVYL